MSLRRLRFAPCRPHPRLTRCRSPATGGSCFRYAPAGGSVQRASPRPRHARRRTTTPCSTQARISAWSRSECSSYPILLSATQAREEGCRAEHDVGDRPDDPHLSASPMRHADDASGPAHDGDDCFGDLVDGRRTQARERHRDSRVVDDVGDHRGEHAVGTDHAEANSRDPLGSQLTLEPEGEGEHAGLGGGVDALARDGHPGGE